MASVRSGARPAKSRARPDPIGPLLAGSTPFLILIALPIAALFFRLDPGETFAHLRSEAALRALALTLQTTLLSALLCAAIGIPVSLLLSRRDFPGRAALDTLVDLPIAIPPVVAGVALLLAFGRFGLIGRHIEALGVQISFSTTAVVLAQTFIASPFFVRAARAGFDAIDPRLEHAARVLGASPWRVFWTVTLPLAAPSIAAGLALAWARALSEFGATITFAGNFPGRTQTLSLAVMSALESDLDTAVAVSVLAILLAVAALLAARAIAKRAIAPEARQ